jgi:hypothetical protein
VSHQNHGGIRTAQNLLIGTQQAHLSKGISVRKVESGFDPCGLQWDEVEATTEQGTFDPL